jgi:hypothetical protein
MAKAKQIMGGLVLEAVTAFGREDRERCKELVRFMDHDRTRRRRSGLIDGYEPPAGQGDRIEAHAARVEAEDPGEEPQRCWGVCGRTLPRGSRPRVHGWRSRVVRCGAGVQVEMHCQECFERWGWIEP